jgi:hypothetical protein
MAENKIRIEVYGVAQAIRELRNLEPTLYKTIVKDLRTSAKPLAQAVANDFPDEPLVNWEGDGSRGATNFPSFNSSTVRARVRPALMTSKPKAPSQYGILRIEQMDAAGAIYDSAGSKTAASRDTDGGRFIMNLDKRLRTKSTKGKTRSRVLYPSTQKNLPIIIPALERSIAQTESEVQKSIMRGK